VADRKSLAEVAHHEAGHAVADHRLGFTSFGCTVVPNDAENTLGSAGQYDGWEDADEARSFVTSLYAGYCAEVVFGADERGARHGARYDFERAAEVLAWLADTTEAAGLEAAFRFVREPAKWNAIMTVAAELEKCGTLDGTEVEILIDVADGTVQRSDLDQYRALKGGR
jgi:sugar phosphate isomerase/epimerase